MVSAPQGTAGAAPGRAGGRVLRLPPVNSVAGLRQNLDDGGCAFGQVSRERVDNLITDVGLLRGEVHALKAQVSYVFVCVLLQLVAFVLAVILYVAQRVH